MTATLAPCADPHTDDALAAIRSTIDVGLKRHRKDAPKEAKQRATIDAALAELKALGVTAETVNLVKPLR